MRKVGLVMKRQDVQPCHAQAQHMEQVCGRDFSKEWRKMERRVRVKAEEWQ